MKEGKTVSFAQKYGLQGLGKPVKISKGTKDAITSLNRSMQDINKKGEEYSKLEKRLFGGKLRHNHPALRGGETIRGGYNGNNKHRTDY